MLKGIQSKVKGDLPEFWLSESCDTNNKALDILLARISLISLSARKIEKDGEERLEFYTFPYSSDMK